MIGICLSVCPSMHVNTGHYRTEPKIYSESVSLEGWPLTIHFPEKVTSGQIRPKFWFRYLLH